MTSTSDNQTNRRQPEPRFVDAENNVNNFLQSIQGSIGMPLNPIIGDRLNADRDHV